MSKKIESMSRTMKDSGIPWIGEIPEGWKTACLKHFCKVNSGREIEMELEASDVDAIPVFGSGGVFKYTNKAQFAGEAVMFGRKGTLGKPIYVNERFWAVDTMYYLTFGNMLKAKYCYYQLSVFNWEPYITQTALPSIVATDIVNSYFAFPPLAEQHLIATFLDKKCSEIDSLIELQEQMIEELKAYKQSVITEAVTKGLNPNVPMKDSGIDWIGEIPEGWGKIRIKHVFEIIGGNGFKDKYQGKDSGEYPFYKTSDINGNCDYVSVSSNYIDADVIDIENYNVVPINSIIVSKIGAAMKKNHRKITTCECCIDNNLQALYPKRTTDDIKYLFYLLKIIDFEWFDNNGTIPSVNNAKLRDLYIPCIPLAEQHLIATFLDKKCSEIDSLITIKQQKIESLKEYKKSVIYEYVTGKKEP